MGVGAKAQKESHLLNFFYAITNFILWPIFVRILVFCSIENGNRTTVCLLFAAHGLCSFILIGDINAHGIRPWLWVINFSFSDIILVGDFFVLVFFASVDSSIDSTIIICSFSLLLLVECCISTGLPSNTRRAIDTHWSP